MRYRALVDEEACVKCIRDLEQIFAALSLLLPLLVDIVIALLRSGYRRSSLPIKKSLTLMLRG